MFGKKLSGQKINKYIWGGVTPLLMVQNLHFMDVTHLRDAFISFSLVSSKLLSEFRVIISLTPTGTRERRAGPWRQLYLVQTIAQGIIQK